MAAASPVTAAVTPPPSLSNAAGTVVSRSSFMPFIAALLTPLPGRPTLTMATSCFGLTSTEAGLSFAIASWTLGESTFFAFTTTIA